MVVVMAMVESLKDMGEGVAVVEKVKVVEVEEVKVEVIEG